MVGALALELHGELGDLQFEVVDQRQADVDVAPPRIRDRDAAEDAFRDELRLSRELVVLPHASEGLLGLAAVAVARGDDHRAARLLGAATEDRRDRPEDPVDARVDTEFFEPARTRHGADAWDAAASDGGTLSFDDAIAYALHEARA